jgi:hypothetical protein
MNETTQARIGKWVRDTLGDAVMYDRHERAMRVLEEAIELAQVEGVSVDSIDKLVARVMSRPVGKDKQEAAGVGITIAAYAECCGFSLAEVVQDELWSIQRSENRKRIRLKQEEKAAAGVAVKPG